MQRAKAATCLWIAAWCMGRSTPPTDYLPNLRRAYRNLEKHLPYLEGTDQDTPAWASLIAAASRVLEGDLSADAFDYLRVAAQRVHDCAPRPPEISTGTASAAAHAAQADHAAETWAHERGLVG